MQLLAYHVALGLSSIGKQGRFSTSAKFDSPVCQDCRRVI